MVSKSTLALEWPVYRPRGWGTPTKARALMRPWAGLDTERDSVSGNFVCGYAVGDNGVAEFRDMRDLDQGTYWVWNLGYDIEGMLRDLRLENGWAARRDGARFMLEGGKAVYYHGKRFDWMAPQGRLSFIEASSFYGRCPLKTIGAKEGVDAKTMSLERYQTDPEYKAAVDSYCIQDARIVYDAVNGLAGGVDALGVEIGATPGATARRFMANMGPLPKLLWETHTPFLRGYCGGRFEITKRGVLHDVKQYDIVSAYPWALTKCPWLTSTAYQRTTRRFNEHALYGVYRVSFSTDEYLGIAPRWHKGVRVYSRGQKDTWLMRPEVEWLQNNGFNVTIHRGVEVFDPNASDLWNKTVRGLFKMKEEGNECFARLGMKCGNKGCKDCKKRLPEAMGAKIVLNSLYGVLIQLVQRSGQWVPMDDAQEPIDFAGDLALEPPEKAFEGGKYYAPLYASTLTALSRVKLLDAGRKAGARYIGGHTDSVLCTGPLDVPIGHDLGEWELECEAEQADVSKTGMYAIGSKVKMRGITRDGTAAVLWADKHTRNQRVGLKRAKTWDEVSVIHATEVANNWEMENKRNWLGVLNRGIVERGEYIDSEALTEVG